jgi:hypothetical protein
MRRRRPEQQLQRAVMLHLHVRGAPNTFVFHPANGGWRSAVEGAILRAMGVVAGTPDIIAIKDGRAFGLELKTATGRLTKIQRDTIARMQRAGAIVGVAHGLDQALAWLELHNLLKGQTQ